MTITRNEKIKRRTNVVGIFPTEGSLISLVSSVLSEQHDEWQVCKLSFRYPSGTPLLHPTPAGSSSGQRVREPVVQVIQVCLGDVDPEKAGSRGGRLRWTMSLHSDALSLQNTVRLRLRPPLGRRHGPGIYRNLRKNWRMSLTRRSGASWAAQWLPRSYSLQETMLVWSRSAKRRIGRKS